MAMSGKKKLVEVFVNVGSAVGEVACHPNGKHIFAVGANKEVTRFVVEKVDDGEEALKQDFSVDHHKQAVNTIMFSKKGDRFATAGKDHTVALFLYPSCKFEANVTRFSGAIHHLAFSPSGNMLAAAGEDSVIKLVNVLDTDQISTLKGHDGAVKSLAYDPDGEYLASAGCDGMLRVWKTSDLSTAIAIPHLPRIDIDSHTQMLRMAWSPDGHLLALPGQRDIVCLERKTWRPAKTFKGAHTDNVSIVAWSPNGRYLASVGEELTVQVWSVDDEKETVTFMQLDSPCVSLQWAPHENSIYMLQGDGHLRKWAGVISEGQTQPFDAAPASAADAAAKTATAAEDAEADALALAAAAAMDEDDAAAGNNAAADEASSPSKRVTHTSELIDFGSADADIEEDDDGAAGDGDAMSDDFGDDSDGGGRRRRLKKLKRRKSRGGATPLGGLLNEPGQYAAAAPVDLQPAFQPSCTPTSDKRRFLVWNMVGSVVSRSEETFNSIEILFNDSTAHRTVRLRDFFNFTMAALGEHGAFFASPPSKTDDGEEAVPSTLVYRPFDSWAQNSQWTLKLPSGEDATAVAVGTTYAAVATSKRFVRVYSYAGVHKFIFCLPGPVVTMVGFQKKLAVVYHGGTPLPGEQNLQLVVYDIGTRRRILQKAMALQPGAKLTWLSYAENGMLMSMDSSGMVYGLSSQWDREWTPLLDTKALLREQSGSKRTRDTYWPVGFIEDRLMCALCKGSSKYPATLPRPVLTAVPLKIPMLDAQSAHVEKEESLLRSKMMLAEVGGATARQQAQLDKQTIHLIQSAAKADKVVRALDLSTHLTLQKSMAIAIKLANHLKKPALAERMNVFMQAKFVAGRNAKKRKEQAAAAAAAAAALGGGSGLSAAPIQMSEEVATGKSTLSQLALQPKRKRQQKQASAAEDEEEFGLGGDDGEDEGKEKENTPTKRRKAAKLADKAKKGSAGAPAAKRVNPFARS